MMYQTTLPSPVGLLTLASDGTALTGLWLEKQKYFASALDADAINAPDLPIFSQTVQWLDAYFEKRSLPALPPLAPVGSPFRRAVWQHLLQIPYGTTTTYGALTAALRSEGIPAAPQAVGGAIGHNPVLLLIPCHRVIGADGSLTGYAAGTEVKRRLLELEGAWKTP